MDIIKKKVFEGNNAFDSLLSQNNYEIVEECCCPITFEEPKWIGEFSNKHPFSRVAVYICKNTKNSSYSVIMRKLTKQNKEILTLALDNCKSITYNWTTPNSLIFIAEDIENKWHIVDGNLLREFSKNTFDYASYNNLLVCVAPGDFCSFIVKNKNKSSILNLNIRNRNLLTVLPYVNGDIVKVSQHFNKNGNKIVLVVTKENNLLTAHLINDEIKIKQQTMMCEDFNVLTNKIAEANINEVVEYMDVYNPEEIEESAYRNLYSNRILFKRNGLWGVAKNGIEIIPPLFSQITLETDANCCFDTFLNYIHSIYTVKKDNKTYILDGIETENAFANVKIKEIVDIKDNSSIFEGSLVKKLLLQKSKKVSETSYISVPYSKEEIVEAKKDPNCINANEFSYEAD